MVFPHPLLADEDGLLAYGGDLSFATLLTAYSWGIFPWYSEPPILWWYTHPRCILYPSKVKVSKSMRSYFNQKKFTITYNQCFSEVMKSCAKQNRKGQDSTWINDEMLNAYIEFHKKGYAHSVEVWKDEELVGGLYGIAIGKMFFGESMFAKASNASKFALISLCRHLDKNGFHIIDCQQQTAHLMSMGAEMITKEDFYHIIVENHKYIDHNPNNHSSNIF